MRILKGPAVSGHELEAVSWFIPETMPLNLEERKSTATFTIGPQAPSIAVGGWLMDDTEPGAGIVWRVKTVEKLFNTDTRTVQLEHIVNTLKDEVMFGEIGPKQITGNSSATTCFASDAVQYILNRHSLWTLGTFDANYALIENPYTFNGEDLLSALETVLSSLPDSYIDYDLSAVPFTLNVKKLDSAIDSEMRMSRNIQTIRRVVDRSRMYTRLYPIGENDLHLDGLYVSQNESTYGTVCRIETEASIKTKAELERWALERLARHCEPSVTVTVMGLELSQDTGEPLDHITINRKCRVPLPEFNTTITEKVTKLSWSDKIREPEKVTVTLANQREDIASIVNRINKAAKSAGRTKAKKDADDHAWIVDDNEHIALVAEKVFGEGVDWSQVASLVVSGDGIYGDVTRTQGDLVIAQGKLIVEADKAALVVKALDQRPILCYANTSKFPATGSSGYLYLANDTGKYYQWNGSAYEEKAKNQIHQVHSGEIVTAINNNSESVARIRADHVTVGANNSLHTLAGAFSYTDDGKLYIADAGGLHVQRTETVEGVETTTYVGVWDKGELTGGMMVTQINGQTTTRIKGNKINIGDNDGTSDVSINDAFEVKTYNSVQSVKIKKQLLVEEKNAYVVGGNLTASKYDGAGGSITGEELHVGTGGKLVFEDRNNSTEVQRADVLGFLDTFSHVALTGPTNNVYTLWYMPNKTQLTLENSTPSTANGWLEVGTFSRAVTGYGYSWGNPKDGRLTVTAQPQGYSAQLLGLVDGGGNWNGNTFTGKVKYYEGSDDETTYETGLTYTVDASARYTAGRNDTKVSSTFAWEHAADYTSGDHNTLTVTTDAPNPVSGASKSLVLYITQDSSWGSNHKKNAYLRTGSSAGNKMAAIEIDAGAQYEAGFRFGWDSVALSDPVWQYPANNPNSDNTTASNSVVVSADMKTDATTRAKTIPIALYVDTANKQAYVSAGGYKRAVESIPYSLTSNAATVTALSSAPDGWTRVSGKYYYTKNGTSGSSKQVRVYLFTEPVVDGNTLNEGGARKTYIEGTVSTIWADAYAEGAASATSGLSVSVGSGTWSLSSGGTQINSGTHSYKYTTSEYNDHWDAGVLSGYNTACNSGHLQFSYPGAGYNYIDVKYPITSTSANNLKYDTARFWLVDNGSGTINLWLGKSDGSTTSIVASKNYSTGGESHSRIGTTGYTTWTCSIQTLGDEKHYSLSMTIPKSKSISGLTNGGTYELYK